MKWKTNFNKNQLFSNDPLSHIKGENWHYRFFNKDGSPNTVDFGDFFSEDVVVGLPASIQEKSLRVPVEGVINSFQIEKGYTRDELLKIGVLGIYKKQNLAPFYRLLVNFHGVDLDFSLKSATIFVHQSIFPWFKKNKDKIDFGVKRKVELDIVMNQGLAHEDSMFWPTMKDYIDGNVYLDSAYILDKMMSIPAVVGKVTAQEVFHLTNGVEILRSCPVYPVWLLENTVGLVHCSDINFNDPEMMFKIKFLRDKANNFRQG